MDIHAQVHRANFAKIAYVEMERCTFGQSRACMQNSWEDAVRRGDLPTPGELMDREYVSLKEWMGVLEIGVNCWGESFPAELMDKHNIESMGLGGAYLTVAPDMRSVLTGFSLHYPNVDTNLSIDISYAKGGLNFTVYYHALNGWVGACFNASAVGLFYKSLKSVSGLRTGDGHQVTIHCPKADSCHLYEEYLNCPVTWEERPDGKLGNTWFVPDHVLDRKNPNSQPEYYNLLSEKLWEYTTAAQRQAGESTSYSSLVRLRLSSAVRIPSQQVIANGLNCSVRTMQQQLKNEGVSWQDLLDTETINRAKGALSGGLSVEAAAQQLGVSPSNLRRRFKAITGKTPREYLADNA